MKLRIVIVFFVLLMIVGCAKEIDRIYFYSLETVEKEITVHESKPLHFWVDLHVKYNGILRFPFDIEVLKNNEPVYKGTCDAMKVSVKVMSTETTINRRHSVKYQGKLTCKTKTLQPGGYLVRITPGPVGDITELIKYDIILKQ